MSSTVKPNVSKQLNYDLGNLKGDAKEVAYIKKQADAAPNHQISAQLAQQLHTAQSNYANNLQAVATDLGASPATCASDKAALAHTADLVNALTNGVQSTAKSLQADNKLECAGKASGDTVSVLQQRQDQITVANSNVLNVANALAPNSDPSNAQAEKEAAALTSGINAQSTEPYAAGHTAAPEGAYDVYSAQAPKGGSLLGATSQVQKAVWDAANRLGVLGTAAQYAPGGLHGAKSDETK